MIKLQIILFIIYLGIPTILLIRVLRNHDKDLIKWIFETVLCASYIGTIFLIGAWSMTYGIYLRYALIFGFILCSLKSFYNTKRTISFKNIGLKQSITYCLILSTSVFLMNESVLGVKGFYCPSNSIELEFPLKNGIFYIVHGGSNELINHHYPISAQRYAIDIVQLNELGLRAGTINPKELSDYKIYGSAIYSPCDGVVISAVDGFPDLAPSEMDPEHPAGNHFAILKKDTEAVIILAHLMKGSLKVKEGDEVHIGQTLGKVGNSGNTTEPHLHIHSVQNHTGDFLYTGMGQPMTFKGRFLTRNQSVGEVGLLFYTPEPKKVMD